MSARIMRRYMITFLIFALFIISALVILEILPFTPNNNDGVAEQQTAFQIARAEFIVKDVFTLAYRPITYHAQAISELQIEIPQFQEAQQGLLHGDTTLNLPSNPPDNVVASLTTAQTDYLALFTAAKTILMTPDKQPDAVEVEIIATHERPYISYMAQVLTNLQQNLQNKQLQFLGIKFVLFGFLILTVLMKYLLFTQTLLNRVLHIETTQQTVIPPHG